MGATCAPHCAATWRMKSERRNDAALAHAPHQRRPALDAPAQPASPQARHRGRSVQTERACRTRQKPGSGSDRRQRTCGARAVPQEPPADRAGRGGGGGVAAELLGVGGGAMDLTIGYLKERKQFGAPIGSFQALQHRAAHLYSEMEVARSAVLKAQQLLDAGDAGADAAVSVAKAMTGMATTLSVQESVQDRKSTRLNSSH